MNKTIGYQLLVYSLLLIGLSSLAYQFAPALTLPALVAGAAGGAVCLVCGVRAIQGARGKALSMLALVPIDFIMLSQSLAAWTGQSHDLATPRLTAVLITASLALSALMTVRIAWAGVIFDVTSPKNREDAAKTQTIGQGCHHHAGKHV